MAAQTPFQRLIARLGVAIVAVVMVAFAVWAATLPPMPPTAPSPLGFQAPPAPPPQAAANATASSADAAQPETALAGNAATLVPPPVTVAAPAPSTPLMSVRDITPQSVTPAPAITAPLVRVPGREPPPPPPERIVDRRLPLVIVEAAGVFRSGAMTIRLSGIAPLAPEQSCTDSRGTAWPCGAQATHAMRALVRSRSIQCRMGEKVRTGEHETSCQLGRIDLARWLVAQGWAEPAEPVTFAAEVATARAEQRGRYRALAAAPLAEPIGTTAMPDLGERITVDPLPQPAPSPGPAAN